MSPRILVLKIVACLLCAAGTFGNGVNATPSWSSDNRIYFISDRGGCDAIWSARVSPAPPALRARQNQEEPNGATDPFASSSDGN